MDEPENGMVALDQPWKDVGATLSHEVHEFPTDPDVGHAIKASDDPAGANFLGWMPRRGGAIGNFPIFAVDLLIVVSKEVPLTRGAESVLVQL